MKLYPKVANYNIAALDSKLALLKELAVFKPDTYSFSFYLTILEETIDQQLREISKRLASYIQSKEHEIEMYPDFSKTISKDIEKMEGLMNEINKCLGGEK